MSPPTPDPPGPTQTASSGPPREPAPGEGAPERGQLLAGPEHFQVEEVPIFDRSGSGEYLYLQVEKRGLTSERVAGWIARALGRSRRDVGYAGRKDRHAVARQWFSVRGGREARVARLETLAEPGSLRVLRVDRDRERLRPGDLAGNRFALGLGGVRDPEALEAALASLDRTGIPNRFGQQRFGAGGSTLARARAWGAGEAASGDRRTRSLVASAAQAAIFNGVLEGRRREGRLRVLEVGDLVRVAAGSLVACSAENRAALQAQAAALGASATGPLPGSRVRRPGRSVEAREREWSRTTGIEWSWLEEGGPLESPGDRRALVIGFREPPSLEVARDRVWLRFALPPGAYATEVLRSLGVSVPARRAEPG
ncbi:MAG: tRNA pseudouridine(13) synthase TruD [Myxococcota bacterium]